MPLNPIAEDQSPVGEAHGRSNFLLGDLHGDKTWRAVLGCAEERHLGRDVLVHVEVQEPARSHVLTVQCALEGETLLELRLDLLRFRKNEWKQRVAFNARSENIAWWMLHFRTRAEMVHFCNHVFTACLAVGDGGSRRQLPVGGNLRHAPDAYGARHRERRAGGRTLEDEGWRNVGRGW
jgi:hypothetical protein